MGSCNPIGVFDSGLGGLSVLKTMMTIMPQEHFIYFGDSKRAPYGTKSVETVRFYSNEIVEDFVARGAKAIVIACNTATSAAAEALRAKHNIPIIGVEPALKPAALENPSGQIVVMATEMTLREEKFSRLMGQYDSCTDIIKMAVPEFVTLVDHGITSGPKITAVLDAYFNELDLKKIKGIVLGCTHYVFLKAAILEYFDNRVRLYDGNEGTAKHLKEVLTRENKLCIEGQGHGQVTIMNSLGDEMVARSYELIGK